MTLTQILNLYQQAKRYVDGAGYSWEGRWQLRVIGSQFTERELLQETAWVILNSGFRESVVRAKFDYLSLCFCDWVSAEEIVLHETVCRSTALAGFGNLRKIDAILDAAKRINKDGFVAVRQRIMDDPLPALQEFSFVGKITACHLAKNLGFSVAKPDRHLASFARSVGRTADVLCNEIQAATGDPVPYIDIVLWRYFALRHQGIGAPEFCPNRLSY